MAASDKPKPPWHPESLKTAALFALVMTGMQRSRRAVSELLGSGAVNQAFFSTNEETAVTKFLGAVQERVAKGGSFYADPRQRRRRGQ